MIPSQRPLSEKGYGRKLIHSGKTFRCNKARDSALLGTTLYWMCDRPGCRVTLVSNGDGEVRSQRGQHTCSTDAVDVLAKRARVTLKASARSSTESTSAVVDSFRTSLPENVQAALPNKMVLQRTVRRARGNELDAPGNPADLAFQIPEKFQFIRVREGDDEEPFIHFDSGNQENRIIIYGTAKSVAYLSICNDWNIDGTFSVAPKNFSQLLTIHGRFADTPHTIPGLFVLLCNKKEATYVQVLESAHALTSHQPSRVMCDFEIALHHAINTVFPDADISCCYFHFAQCNRRKADQTNLRISLENDATLALTFRKFRALAYLPRSDVIATFERLVANLDPRLNQFKEYFERVFIGSKRRGNRRDLPLFPIRMWNISSRAESGDPVTNNALEGFHNKLADRMPLHPTIWVFIEKLKDMMRSSLADLLDLEAGKTLSSISRKWKTVQARKALLIKLYKPSSSMDFLNNMANVL